MDGTVEYHFAEENNSSQTVMSVSPDTEGNVFSVSTWQVGFRFQLDGEWFGPGDKLNLIQKKKGVKFISADPDDYESDDYWQVGEDFIFYEGPDRTIGTVFVYKH